jgi:cell division septation protein DedD
LPKNDEGEFELVLGNRQLISVFVIVVVLLGVFFSMGYIVGRNSSPVSQEARNEKAKSESADSTAPDPTADTPADSSTTPPAIDSAPSSSTDAAPPESTKPAQSVEPPPRPKPEPARSAKEVKPEVKPKPSPAPAAAAPVHAAAAGEPAGGQYWQVVATARPDAEIIAEALGKKGFHVVLAPAPKDGVFRVLVGPLGDASTQASTRTNLESAGFKNPIIRKY